MYVREFDVAAQNGGTNSSTRTNPVGESATWKTATHNVLPWWTIGHTKMLDFCFPDLQCRGLRATKRFRDLTSATSTFAMAKLVVMASTRPAPWCLSLWFWKLSLPMPRSPCSISSTSFSLTLYSWTTNWSLFSLVANTRIQVVPYVHKHHASDSSQFLVDLLYLEPVCSYWANKHHSWVSNVRNNLYLLPCLCMRSASPPDSSPPTTTHPRPSTKKKKLWSRRCLNLQWKRSDASKLWRQLHHHTRHFVHRRFAFLINSIYILYSNSTAEMSPLMLTISKLNLATCAPTPSASSDKVSMDAIHCPMSTAYPWTNSSTSSYPSSWRILEVQSKPRPFPTEAKTKRSKETTQTSQKIGWWMQDEPKKSRADLTLCNLQNDVCSSRHMCETKCNSRDDADWS